MSRCDFCKKLNAPSEATYLRDDKTIGHYCLAESCRNRMTHLRIERNLKAREIAIVVSK